MINISLFKNGCVYISALSLRLKYFNNNYDIKQYPLPAVTAGVVGFVNLILNVYPEIE